MPVNIEIKARARDPQGQQRLAASISTSLPEVLDQVDTFFDVPAGRLKLRELKPDLGQLIHYLRDDIRGPKESTFLISTTREPAKLRAVLAAALGVRGEVRKRRTIYLVGQARIHFDEVKQLGSFLELEVVLQAGQSHADGVAIASALMKRLGVEDADLIDAAYIDLVSRLADIPR